MRFKLRICPMIIALTAAACGGITDDDQREQQGQHQKQQQHTLTVDFDDAVASTILDPESGLITNTIQDPDQTETLLELSWNATNQKIS